MLATLLQLSTLASLALASPLHSYVNATSSSSSVTSSNVVLTARAPVNTGPVGPIADLPSTTTSSSSSASTSSSNSASSSSATINSNLTSGAYCPTNGGNQCAASDVISICANHTQVLLNCNDVLGGLGAAACVLTSGNDIAVGACQVGASNYSAGKSTGPILKSSKGVQAMGLSKVADTDEDEDDITEDALPGWNDPDDGAYDPCTKTVCSELESYVVLMCFNGTAYPVNCNDALSTSFGGATCINWGESGQGVCEYANATNVVGNGTSVNSTTSSNASVVAIP
ncbi:hypothetical protein SAICODRAFT_149140 [Saitoella complicata NRRL Y-17804]|uniref:Carbohydrate-binding module family 19 domain-containing protein n=1 Tax=Saitoella complicata (strain BCRC 22490 / CBS 7301 / JCM 7358 / NBRC 10748 / NRRL Y-17804) TaxID=698492 RepID=A0A0E9N7Z6_SAICN|nr:uncharacterized protein SAICODRAFT_149140 [Saitoella complicata NRRL Y-17804]ODQ55622.1 hypothetical protein SAICODRAFT_149140 [Saitoella complicata NRRL Y-17804]GAO46037.1 hypothetical protein G7K_0282-t1 [Saitoella complicata NRRL Y-17804]